MVDTWLKRRGYVETGLLGPWLSCQGSGCGVSAHSGKKVFANLTIESSGYSLLIEQ